MKTIQDRKLGLIEKGKRRIRRNIIRLSVYLAVFLLIIVVVAGTSVYAYNAFVKTVLVANGVIDEWQAEAGTEATEVEQDDTTEKLPTYGVYPVDNELRIKQEMMEICNYAGNLYNVPGKLVLGLAMVETTVHEKLPAMANSNGSLYTDLCIEYAYAGSNKKSLFVDNSTNFGKYTDKGGNLIVDPLKVGKIDTSVKGAIGPFQFYSTYIEGMFTRMMVIDNGQADKKESMQLMGYYDKELGFMRPNPLYFPDAALNAAAKLRSHMDQHSNKLNDITKLGLPKSIQDEIMFLYAADAYHGDTAAMGNKAKMLHENMAKMYGDIYVKYSKEAESIKSLGDFFKSEYSRPKIRAILGGIPFSTQGNIDFDGTFNRESKLLQTDSLGKYLELSGYKYYKPLVASVSNSAPFNTDYRAVLANMPATSGSGSDNKYSWIYGFEAINTSSYFTNLWENQIEQAEKTGEEDGLPINKGDGTVVADAYPVADIPTWIEFQTRKGLKGELANLDNVFLGRLAKFAEDRGKKVVIISGYRSVEDQRSSIDYQKSIRENNGTLTRWSYEEGVYATNAYGEEVCYAAGQYKSRHRLGIAADVNGFTNISNRMLEKYGLYKPMSYEQWHVEPVETHKK